MMMDQDERHVVELTESLKEWRYVLLVLDRWLKWEKDQYPMIMSGVLTVGFSIFWYLAPPVLSALAFVIMCICVVDYVVPRMEEFGFSTTDEWSDEKEKAYREICTNIIWVVSLLQISYHWVKTQREQKPKMFFCGALMSLLLVGFIAGAIPNLFLIYLIVMTIVLLPGLHKKGYLLQWKIVILQHFIEIVRKMREGRLKG